MCIMDVDDDSFIRLNRGEQTKERTKKKKKKARFVDHHWLLSFSFLPSLSLLHVSHSDHLPDE